ncbi:MAG: cell division protein FtsW [Phycisphaerales bacterium]|jgi:cell division protein FtsW
MLCAVALLMLGVVMVSSAGMAVQPIAPGADPSATAAASGVTLTSIMTSRPMLYMAIALAAMIVAFQIPAARLADRATATGGPAASGKATAPAPLKDYLWLLVSTLAIIAVIGLVYVPGIARPVNGAHRWIDLGIPGLNSVQPSELAKWLIIPVVALYAARLTLSHQGGSHPDELHPDESPPNRLGKFFTGLLPGLVAVGVVAAFVVVEDLGTGFLIAVVGAFMLLAGGAKLRHFAWFVPPAIAGITFAIITSPYRVRRILAFLDPYADPMGDGFHMIQSMQTVAGAGPFGRGLGHGLQKFGYLPEDTTDFLFAIICEELGLAGASLVIALYVIMIWAALSIAARETRPLLKLVVLGVTATVAIQACINLVVVTGLGPTKGIALPLLSAGGTGWILTSAMLGLVASIDRTAPQYEDVTETEAEESEEELDDEAEAEPGYGADDWAAEAEGFEGESAPLIETLGAKVPRWLKPRVRLSLVGPSEVADAADDPSA